MYAVILLTALWLNKENRKVLLLILMVALTHYLPVGILAVVLSDQTTLSVLSSWYTICIVAEIFVIIYSWLTKTYSSLLNIVPTTLLLSAHLASCFSAHMKEYMTIALVLGYAQILCFVLTTPPIVHCIATTLKPYFIKKEYTCRTQQSGYLY